MGRMFFVVIVATFFSYHADAQQFLEFQGRKYRLIDWNELFDGISFSDMFYAIPSGGGVTSPWEGKQIAVLATQQRGCNVGWHGWFHPGLAS